MSCLRGLKHHLWSWNQRGTSRIDILAAFPLFRPNSAGSYKDRAALTVETINNAFPFLAGLTPPLLAIPLTPTEGAAELKELLDAHGSDKARKHNYHYLYASLLRGATTVFEIGLGTNNTDVVSHMGKAGRPGASLRAFRDYLPDAQIYGADIDTRVLFTEERIQTFFLDQTKPETFPDFKELDVVIDDGLHSVDANVTTLTWALPRIKVGGYIVIEDIAAETLPFWQVVAALLPEGYTSRLYEADGAWLFTVHQI